MKWIDETRKWWREVKRDQRGMGGLNLLWLAIIFSLIAMCNGYS